MILLVSNFPVFVVSSSVRLIPSTSDLDVAGGGTVLVLRPVQSFLPKGHTEEDAGLAIFMLP